MNPFCKLLGTTVETLLVDEPAHHLKFLGATWKYQMKPQFILGVYADGDCCSESWFADIVGVENLLGHEIIGIEIMQFPDTMPETDNRSRQEYDSYYGVKLKTTKGYVDIVYRNSSNGYYGGSAEEFDEDWEKQYAKDVKWKEVTEDFQA